MSLKNAIENCIGYEWINGCEWEKLALELGYKPSNASRRCRELYREGKAEKRINERGQVEYRRSLEVIYKTPIRVFEAEGTQMKIM